MGQAGSTPFWNLLLETVDNQLIETEKITDLNHLIATTQILKDFKRFDVLQAPNGKKLQEKLHNMIKNGNIDFLSLEPSHASV